MVWWVEHEAPYSFDELSTGPEAKALILYHPSRDAHFSDDLTRALAAGLFQANLAVSRATMTGKTDPSPRGYAVVAVVTNTFFGRPDWPTSRYLARADFGDTPVIAITAGAGDTDAAQRALENAVRRAHGNLIASRALWTKRPNAAPSDGQDNRAVAKDIARKLAVATGWKVKLGASQSAKPSTDKQVAATLAGAAS